MIQKQLTEISMRSAVQYCFDNPTIAMHSIAVDHGIKDKNRLKHEYRKEWYIRKYTALNSTGKRQ